MLHAHTHMHSLTHERTLKAVEGQGGNARRAVGGRRGVVRFGESHHWFFDSTELVEVVGGLIAPFKRDFCRAYARDEHFCFGPHLVNKYGLDNLLQFARTYQKSHPRTYAFFHSNSNHWCNRKHHKANVPDPDQANPEAAYGVHRFLWDLLRNYDEGFIKRLPLILIVGDHGPSGFDLKNPRQNRPFVRVLAPTMILEEHPHVAKALASNQDKLISHYDMYEALHWLATGNKTDSRARRRRPDKQLLGAFCEKELKLWDPMPPIPETMPLNFLLDPVPADRSCPEAGVPGEVPGCKGAGRVERIHQFCSLLEKKLGIEHPRSRSASSGARKFTPTGRLRTFVVALLVFCLFDAEHLKRYDALSAHRTPRTRSRPCAGCP